MEGMRHGVFIWSAYGVTGLVVLGLILRAVIDHRMQAKALARLGADGEGERG